MSLSITDELLKNFLKILNNNQVILCKKTLLLKSINEYSAGNSENIYCNTVLKMNKGDKGND